MVRRHGWRLALLCGTALVPAMASAQIAPNAAPNGGQVVAGQASIGQTAAQTTIRQGSDRAVIDWRGFNVGSDHTVQFQQPSASSMTLNRVTGPDPSIIAGRITANGGIAIVNQSGVLVTGGARIEAQSVIVSTADIANQAFMSGAGRLAFDRPGRADARIENQGSITVREAGLAALVAPQVANRGTINARLGRVVLGGATTHAVDLHGDGLLSLEITAPVRQAPANGEALVSNTGLIDAPGGSIQLTAQAADGIVQNLVRAGGRIAANTDAATGRPGRVLVSGTGGTVRIEGEVTATGLAAGQTGGTVDILADGVQVASGARVDASGAAGGGAIGLGTTRRGAATPRLARRTVIAPNATVRADATVAGNGGTILVNSTETTIHAGEISARGGPGGGDGGFVEVSGQRGLSLTGTVDVGATAGQLGTILLDPTDLTVVAAGDPRLNVNSNLFDGDGELTQGEGPANAFISASVISGFAANLRLEASQDIFVQAAITKPLGDLTLDAGRTLAIDAPIILQGASTTLGLDGSAILIRDLVQVPTSGTILLTTENFTGNSAVQSGNGRFTGGLLSTGTGRVVGTFNTLDLRGDNRVDSISMGASTSIDFRNVIPLVVPAGGGVGADNVRIDVENGGLTIGGTVRGFSGPFAAQIRTAGDIVLQAGGLIEGDGIRLIAGYDFLAGAADPTSAAAIRLGDIVNAAFSEGPAGDVELTAGRGGIQQTGGQIYAGQLRLNTPGDANLAVTPALVDDGNVVGTLGASSVGGNLSLTTGLSGLNLAGDIQVNGSMTLRSRTGAVRQLAGSRLLVTSLDATTPGNMTLGGNNRIGTLTQLTGGGQVTLRNVIDLAITGPVTSGTTAGITVDVDGGNLGVAGAVTGGTGVTLRASGNINLAATGAVTAVGTGAPALQILAANDFTGVAPGPLAGGLTLAGTVGAASGSNAITLGAGLGGIRQNGGRLIGSTLAVASAADVILDRGGDQTGLRNAINGGGLNDVTIPGDFVFDNGVTPIVLNFTSITAANIRLRTEGEIVLSGSSFPSGLDAGTGDVSLRASELTASGAFIRGGLVQIAPALPSQLSWNLAGAPAGSMLVNVDPAAITSTTLQLGATTFRGVTETTATSIVLGDALAVPNTLRLDSTGAVTQEAGADLTVGRLTGATGSAALTNPGNSVATLGDFGVGSTFTLVNDQALIIDGLVQAPVAASLTVAGALSETGAGRIAGGGLALDVAGAITLTGDNAVGFLGPVTAGGDVQFRNTVDTLLTGAFSAPGRNVTFDVTGAIRQLSGATLTAALLSGQASSNTILDGANRIDRLRFSVAGGDFRLNNLTPALTVPSGDTLSASGGVFVTTSGDLSVTGSIVAQQVNLTAGGSIGSKGAGTVQGSTLALQAGGPIDLGVRVDTLASLQAGGDVRLDNLTDLLLAGPVNLPGHALILNSAGITQAPGSVITAASLQVASSRRVLLGGNNRIDSLRQSTIGFSGDGGGGDFTLVNGTALLRVPAGNVVSATGQLAITQAGDLVIDGTVTGAATSLTAGGALTVNGFSAIARTGDLALRGDAVTANGLVSAGRDILVDARNFTTTAGAIAQAGRDILVNAAASATMAGRTSAPAGALRIAAPLVTFSNLNAGDTPLVLSLGADGRASGTLDIRAVNVLGGSGVTLSGGIAGVVDGSAATIGRRGTAGGTPQPQPPRPFDFLFNGCPIGLALCGAVPITPDLIVLRGAVTVADAPGPVIDVLDPFLLDTATAFTRPTAPSLTTTMARDRSDDEELAPPNIRGGDY